MNGRANCILEICCRQGSTASLDALTDQIVEDLDCEPSEARKHATWMKKHFDLAPAGTLGALKQAIAKLALEPRE